MKNKIYYFNFSKTVFFTWYIILPFESLMMMSIVLLRASSAALSLVSFPSLIGIPVNTISFSITSWISVVCRIAERTISTSSSIRNILIRSFAIDSVLKWFSCFILASFWTFWLSLNWIFVDFLRFRFILILLFCRFFYNVIVLLRLLFFFIFIVWLLMIIIIIIVLIRHVHPIPLGCHFFLYLYLLFYFIL